MKKTLSYKIENPLLIMVGVLIVMLLSLSITTYNRVDHSRTDRAYTVIQDVDYQQIRKEEAPTGLVNEYRFTIEEMGHANTLAFWISHHNIEVYLDEECVYSLSATEDSIQTTGSVWTMIPLYAEDMGREVRVVLSPLYRNYQDKVPEFLVGSEFSIHQSAFYQALPELFLSLCVVLTGVFLICLAIYHSMKHNSLYRLYAIGMLAISAGVWRITYGNYIYLLFQKYSVFLYTLSIVSLMLVALSMLNCVETVGNPKSRNVIRFCYVIYCVIDIVQFILQIAGVLDQKNNPGRWAVTSKLFLDAGNGCHDRFITVLSGEN